MLLCKWMRSKSMPVRPPLLLWFTSGMLSRVRHPLQRLPPLPPILLTMWKMKSMTKCQNHHHQIILRLIWRVKLQAVDTLLSPQLAIFSTIDRASFLSFSKSAQISRVCWLQLDGMAQLHLHRLFQTFKPRLLLLLHWTRLHFRVTAGWMFALSHLLGWHN